MVACNSHQTTPRSRARDQLSQYFIGLCLKFEIYRASPLSSERRTKKLLRLRRVDLPFDGNADPFAAVIRCMCGDGADNKMISKWARALRYAVRRKPPAKPLRAFMKDAGGINECAAGYANVKRRRQ